MWYVDEGPGRDKPLKSVGPSPACRMWGDNMWGRALSRDQHPPKGGEAFAPPLGVGVENMPRPQSNAGHARQRLANVAIGNL